MSGYIATGLPGRDDMEPSFKGEGKNNIRISFSKRTEGRFLELLC